MKFVSGDVKIASKDKWRDLSKRELERDLPFVGTETSNLGRPVI